MWKITKNNVGNEGFGDEVKANMLSLDSVLYVFGGTWRYFI